MERHHFLTELKNRTKIEPRLRQDLVSDLLLRYYSITNPAPLASLLWDQSCYQPNGLFCSRRTAISVGGFNLTV